MAEKKTSPKKKVKPKQSKKSGSGQDIAGILTKIGIVLIILAIGLLFFIFYPVLLEEAKYIVSDRSQSYEYAITGSEITAQNSEITPINMDFGIIVPKINANAPVIANVDPYNSKEYQQKLTQGVAHAKGTSLPDINGNTFLFAHSSANFYEANRFNSVFYLLHRLEIGDQFFISHDGNLYEYIVDEVKTVAPESIDYLTGVSAEKTATLMTCWPPGTTLNRLVVVGKQVE